jgi:hypothetical protein
MSAAASVDVEREISVNDVMALKSFPGREKQAGDLRFDAA